MQIDAEKKIEQPSGTSLDSPIIDRYIIRKISGFITGFLVRTPVTPNQVTAISLILGLIAAVIFSFGGHTHTITAGLIFFLCIVFDQCDGEVARIKNMETEFGRSFDIIVDSIVSAAIVAGITFALYKASGSGFHIIIGLLAIIGISISIFLATYLGKENKTDTGTQEMLDKLNNKDFFYIIMLASVIFNQMIWFLLIMAVGTNIYWIVHKIAHRKIAT
ncbi:MAG: CDP-alcohol phosphatidyltransferase family protein [Planctomycetota bacterium]|jgi:CDP-L-myo-inositol myo-inositolphosphotransferase